MTIASFYQVILRNQLFEVVAIFDDVISCQYTNEINAVGSFTLQINYDDPRVNYFEVDGIVEIHRSVPGLGMTWYLEFIGLYRTCRFAIDESGRKTFEATGVGLNDFLARTIINYPQATVKSYKNMEAEKAMKQYVTENCGIEALAAVPYERNVDGVLPNFLVDPSLDLGAVWEGDRACENLLDVLRDIAAISGIDFNVTWDSVTEMFTFFTYEGQMGLEREWRGMDVNTGLNIMGNIPVIFSYGFGNIISIDYTYDRISEVNTVTVLGDGDGATRDIVVRSEPISLIASPWNRREASRAQGGYASEMEAAGDAALKELAAKEVINFKPMLQPNLMYGKDYFLGDLITIIVRDAIIGGIPQQIIKDKRITKVSNSVEKGDGIVLTFSDI
jgi:hypothetical protein